MSIIFEKNTTIIIAIKLEQYIADIRILSIVIHKFCHKQEFCFIILFSIDKGTKINFHHAVLPFGLTVCLQMKGGRKFLLNAKKIA